MRLSDRDPFSLLLAGCVGGLFLSLVLVSHSACTGEQAKTAKDVIVRVADDVCKEEGKQPDEPELVAIACTAEGILAHVVLPKKAWYARGPSKDAGPGK